MRFLKLLILSIASTTALSVVAATPFKAQLDSTNLLMGKTISLKYSLVEVGDTNGAVKPDLSTLPGEIEFVNADAAISSRKDIGNGRYELTGEYILQSFDSGDYQIPGLIYINSKGDTLRSNQLALKVIPVDVSDMTGIEGDAGVLSPGRKLADIFPPYWPWILVGLIILVGSVGAYLILTRRVKPLAILKKKELPPYVVAMNALNDLKQQNLLDAGRDKQFYTNLTDILRVYLQGRFGINAMEMTSSQINRALSDNPETRESKKLMSEILNVADFVKFAKAIPNRDENIRNFNYAVDFVESTKPIESQPADNPDKQSPSNNE